MENQSKFRETTSLLDDVQSVMGLQIEKYYSHAERYHLR
jgi:hypothetical protein